MKWVSIPGFDGYYASDCGQIKGPKGLRKLCKTPRGYLRISLHGKTVGVHRLVLFAFHGRSSLHVNHKNGIKHDNRLCNLEFVTQVENNHHAHKMGLYKPLYGQRNGQSKLCESDIRIILSSKKTIVALAQQFGVTHSLISKIRLGKLWKKAKCRSEFPTTYQKFKQGEE